MEVASQARQAPERLSSLRLEQVASFLHPSIVARCPESDRPPRVHVPMTTPNSDIAVIGAGIVGLSAAYAAQQRGLSVTVYNSGPVGGGQSAGQARIFRHAHADPRLVAMAAESREIWRVWEAEFGTELVSPDGAVAIGPGVDDKLDVLAGFPQLSVRRIGQDELAEVMPLLAPFDGPAMLDETGGSIRTQAAIGALASRLRDSIVADHVLTLRETREGSVEVRTGTRCQEHGHVLVCAGRGTAPLARGVGLSLPVRLGAHVRVTFAVTGPPPARVATLQDSSSTFGETGIYAAAYPGNSHYAVGLSESVQVRDDGSFAEPAELAQLARRAAEYTARALPGLAADPVEFVHCWVTELPWSEDAVAVWRSPAASFVAGHNLFKQAPGLGQALVESVMDGQLPTHLTPEARLGETAPLRPMRPGRR